jgi:molecular chaperone GrpE
MQEPATSGVAENAPVGRSEGLTPEAIETVLAEFRGWLQESATPEVDREAVTLDRVLEQFIALRQDVNLQTKASRAQLEHNVQALDKLGDALDSLRQTAGAVEELDRQAEEERLRPLLKSVVEVHDNLLRAHRETQKVREAMLATLNGMGQQASNEAGPSAPVQAGGGPRESWWSRWFGNSPSKETMDLQLEVTGLQQQLEVERKRFRDAEAERSQQVAAATERVGRVLEGVLAGYRMGLEKVEAMLRQYGLEAVPAEGQMYDPERMEVLEAVANSGRGNNEVLEEVRRGYLWRGRIFRYALVRVAKG